MNDARNQFATIAAREPVPLARGALLIAKEEYPDLDVEKYIDRLAALAREAEPWCVPAPTPSSASSCSRISCSRRRASRATATNYSDPRNSFLNEVLDRRLGIPITLSVVYLEVGRRLGINLYGVSFPAHFLVKAVDERGELIIDPFCGGTILGLDEIRARLAEIYNQPVEVHPAMIKAVGDAPDPDPDAAQSEGDLLQPRRIGRARFPRSIGSCCSIRARPTSWPSAARSTSGSNASRPRSTTFKVSSRRPPSIPAPTRRAKP